MPGVLLPIDQTDLRFDAAGGTAVARTVHPSGLRILSEQVAAALLLDQQRRVAAELTKLNQAELAAEQNLGVGETAHLPYGSPASRPF